LSHTFRFQNAVKGCIFRLRQLEGPGKSEGTEIEWNTTFFCHDDDDDDDVNLLGQNGYSIQKNK